MIGVYLIALCAPLLAALGQVMLKCFSVNSQSGYIKWKRLVEFGLSAIFFSASAAIGIISMRFLEFSIFYSLTALNFVFVAVLARLIIGERFDMPKLLGILITVLGVLVYNL